MRTWLRIISGNEFFQLFTRFQCVFKYSIFVFSVALEKCFEFSMKGGFKYMKKFYMCNVCIEEIPDTLYALSCCDCFFCEKCKYDMHATSKVQQIPGNGGIVATIPEINMPQFWANFEEVGIYEKLLGKLQRVPTLVERYVMPMIASGKDLIGCINGCGKISSFLIPIITCLLSDLRDQKEGSPQNFKNSEEETESETVSIRISGNFKCAQKKSKNCSFQRKV